MTVLCAVCAVIVPRVVEGDTRPPRANCTSPARDCVRHPAQSQEGSLYLVMPLVDGLDLREVLSAKGR